jgi:hypothetical protein
LLERPSQAVTVRHILRAGDTYHYQQHNQCKYEYCYTLVHCFAPFELLQISHKTNTVFGKAAAIRIVQEGHALRALSFREPEVDFVGEPSSDLSAEKKTKEPIIATPALKLMVIIA